MLSEDFGPSHFCKFVNFVLQMFYSSNWRILDNVASDAYFFPFFVPEMLQDPNLIMTDKAHFLNCLPSCCLLEHVHKTSQSTEVEFKLKLLSTV